jgi:hypothetical protein
MDAKNHLRKSDINSLNLDTFFLQDTGMQGRKSFSINQMSSFDLINLRCSLSKNYVPLQILSPSNKVPKKL